MNFLKFLVKYWPSLSAIHTLKERCLIHYLQNEERNNLENILKYPFN